MKRHYPLHIQISTLFLVLLLVVGGLLAGISYTTSRDMLESSAEDLTLRISREIQGDFQRLIVPVEMAVGMLSYDRLTRAESLRERMEQLDMLRDVLDKAPALSSLYFGYGSGDFFFVRRLRNDADRALFNAPPNTRYMVQSIERGGGSVERGSYLYLGNALEVLRQEDKPDYPSAYDPRTRGWFNDAFSAPSAIRTPPYLFFSSRKVGMTLATRSNLGFGVVGADIELDTLGERLARQKVTPGTQIALVDAEGYLVAHEDVSRLVTVGSGPDAKPALTLLRDSGLPALPLLAPRIAGMQGTDPVNLRLEADGADWRVAIKPLLLEGGKPIYLVSAIPDRELLFAAKNQRSTALLITALIIAFAVPVVWLLARAVARPLNTLAAEADAIRHFDFSKPSTVSSVVDEIDQLAVTMEGMKLAIRRFLDISLVIAAEKDIDRLLPMLLTEIMSAADADVAVLYLGNDGRLLPVAMRDAHGADADLPELVPGAAGPLVDNALQSGIAGAAPLQDGDLAAMGGNDPFAALGALQGVAVPLLNRQRELVGLMLLRRRTVIEDAQLSFVQAMSGLYAGVLETRELIRAQKELFEAFIRLIAGAIDAKSPYTGGHCERVPELTKMLAAAACAQTEGPFRDFRLDEEDWEAVHVASWLHDCGKVTTPEYIVDKATKLETIYDRIHEVRTRFEVLKRDAEIACLKAVAAGEPAPAATARLAAELKQLDDDFAFVAACNEGGEFMAPEKIERLKAIGQRTWIRTLDDRIGIAHEEKARKERAPAPALPAVETLLADKPEHRFERRPQDRMPEDNKWGFRMPVPELLYNKGEFYNLSVARGTLSEEERYKINEHIVQTLVMLSQLPFPKHLRGVPEIAGGHHEKMDGTGYPKRLTREQMSPVARMMAIADIFEALTAVDRPYKKGKKLSEALKIMSFMIKDKHIDPELFELFLRSGIHREYAEKFMRPEQIDEVDIGQYLGKIA
ncbi:MAG: HAMP domain-containing protein [Burkholderiales bacterium]|nr:HAMP domain-containing protein [Burkholderiales bacterium]